MPAPYVLSSGTGMEPTVILPMPRQPLPPHSDRTEEIHMPEPSAPPERPKPVPDFLEKTAPGAKIEMMEEPAGLKKEASPVDNTGAALASAFIEGEQSKEEIHSATVEGAAGAYENFSPPVSNGDVTSLPVESAPVAPAAPPRKPEDQTQPIQEEAMMPEADELTTQTLAELYVQQGLIDKAVKVYQKLLLNDPNNSQITKRLRELKPADALVSTPQEKSPPPPAKKMARILNGPAQDSPENRDIDHLAEERKRKISTLENWLASIRRER
jgi:hypothetical protein